MGRLGPATSASRGELEACLGDDEVDGCGATTCRARRQFATTCCDFASDTEADSWHSVDSRALFLARWRDLLRAIDEGHG